MYFGVGEILGCFAMALLGDFKDKIMYINSLLKWPNDSYWRNLNRINAWNHYILGETRIIIFPHLYFLLLSWF